MTLTEMLFERYGHEEVLCVGNAKGVFKQWLKEVGLPLITGNNKNGVTFDATESLRKLLITLVDEP